MRTRDGERKGPDRQRSENPQGSQGSDPRNPRTARVSGPRRAGEAARFWRRVDRSNGPDAEWPFLGAKKKGYGRVRVFRNGRWTHMPAHRWAYEDAYGPIPDGIYLDHTCHTNDPTCPGGDTCPHRACCNPAHLEPVSDEENRRRARARRGTR